MAKKYDKYSAERRARLSADGKEAVEVFSHAYEMGSALIEARQERALTQRALADLSGVQQADISRMERGILAPTTTTLMRLVEALDGRLVIELVRTEKKKSVAFSLSEIELKQHRNESRRRRPSWSEEQ